MDSSLAMMNIFRVCILSCMTTSLHHRSSIEIVVKPKASERRIGVEQIKLSRSWAGRNLICNVSKY